MYKVDLHTHSVASPDGGLTAVHYEQALRKGLVDFIAITDHNRIDFALQLQAQVGDKIIVGEEIMTRGGEVIGLYLNRPVPPGLTPKETVDQIKSQGGVVYIPHPFETLRKGMHPRDLEELIDNIDVIEACNGRAFLQNRSQQVVVWARLNHVTMAASSDAHGWRGVGSTYSLIPEQPTAKTITSLLAAGTLITNRPGMRALLYPKYHRLRKRLQKGHV